MFSGSGGRIAARIEPQTDQIAAQIRAFRSALAATGLDLPPAQASSAPGQLAELQEHVVAALARQARPEGSSVVPHEREAWFRGVLDTPAVGLVSVDAATHRFVYVNDGYCRITGYERHELLRMTPEVITHPDDRLEAYNRVERLFDGSGSDYEHEKRYVRKDGSLVWVRVSARLLPTGPGERPRTLGVVTDVTRGKRAEAALEESEERFRRAVESSPFPGIIHAEGGAILMVNAAWAERSGYSQEDIPDIATWASRAFGDARAQVEAAFAELYTVDRTVAQGEYVVTTSQGAKRVWDFFSLPLGRADDGRRLVFSTATDVTERKAAERALRDSSERFTTLADNISQLAWMADETGWLFWYNKRWFEYTGTSLPEMEGSGWQKVHHPDHVARVTRTFSDAVRAGVAWEDTFPLRSRDGEWRWFLSRAVPIHDAEGRARRWFGTNTDITPLLDAEAALRRLNETLEARVRQRTEALERANAELESFSYSVAHDLRGPLRAIDGFSRALEEGGEGTAAHLVRIRGAVKRMSQLIDDLLNLSRIGRIDMRRAPVDLGALATEVAAELRLRDPDRHVLFEIAPACATADPAFLRILLENLLGNAWKFTGGRDPARIAFGTDIVEGEPVFFVRDNGVGFDMAYADQLFRPFQRLHTQSQFPGTGIGLALAARIVSRHGGRIWADAAEGSGATFSFTLPPEGLAQDAPERGGGDPPE